MIIIGISGSPRGAESQTLRLVAAVLAGARAGGAETELADVGGLRFAFCTACETCHATGQCVHHDEAARLIDRLMKADGIVLGSPNYFRNVTAPMKAFLDRMSRIIHGQLFTGKYGCSVATAGGPAPGIVTDYLNDTLISLGVYAVGRVAVSLSEGPDALARGLDQANALGRDLAAAIAGKRVYEDQKKTHERTAAYFRHLVERNRDRWPHEHEAWIKQGS
jgi:multimeric flavodoxin WrbA